MARFLMATIPVVGHVSPGVSIAQTLVARGHEVWWYTGGAFQPIVERTGARFLPIRSGIDYSYPEQVPQSWVEQRRALQGLAQLKFDLRHFFIDAALGQFNDLTDILKDFPADVLVTDSFFLGGSWISERDGVPWAEFGISVLGFNSRDTAPFGLGLPPNATLPGRWRNRLLGGLQQLLLRELTAHTNKLRSNLNLPATTPLFFDTLSPFLYLAGTVPSFEYPRSDLPAQVHFVGPLLLARSSDFVPPDWWPELQQDKPIVLVTQGTVATQLGNLLIPALQGLAEENLLVIATTGGEAPENLPLVAPANARIAPFIPFADLLPFVDVMITNGGFNGVQMALSHGVPLVAAGRTEDKAEICARIEWSGVGINLKTQTPTPEQIRSAVQTLLSDRRYRDRAKAVQTEMSRCDAALMSATLLEQLAETKQPILSR
jgi:MGT family glycosyltransferase